MAIFEFVDVDVTHSCKAITDVTLQISEVDIFKHNLKLSLKKSPYI